MKDWMERAIKTFAQAFLGILIPEVCAILTGATIVSGLDGLKAVLIPLLCSALAAGISAVWNIWLEKQRTA